jgi:hypothetical protein
LRLTTALIACFMLCLAGCKARPVESARQTQLPPTMQAPTEVSKVKVDQAGAIYLNGKSVTIEDLRQELTRLKRVNGGVWYYLEDPLNSQAKAAERAIFDARVPIKMFRNRFQ